MPKAGHFAIVIGISDYKLADLNLNGSENDAIAFENWLSSPSGGDLYKENINTVLSSHYHSNGANPTPNEIEAQFEQFIVQGQGGRYAQRLYVYVAAHGFGDPGNVSATAIYAANALKTLPWHVAITHYVDWLRRHAVFDEIILIMDCCRTVNSHHVIRTPQFPETSGSPNAASVRYFGAFAVGRDKVARERLFEDGLFYGIFTKTVLQALEVTPPVNGQVTGQLLKQQIHNNLDSIAGGIDVGQPEIIVDTFRDIVFLERNTAGNFSARLTVHPHSGNETLVLFNESNSELSRMEANNSVVELRLSRGLYKIQIENTERHAIFEVPNDGNILI